MTRSLLAALFLVIAPVLAAAQTQSQEDLKKRHEKTLQEPFLKKAPWFLDYDNALAEAKKTGKPIFAYFTRSFAD